MSSTLRKIIIVGISGTGKSALGRRLANKTGLPLYHMDSIIWSPGWNPTAEDVIYNTLNDISKNESWIVEGWVDTYSKDLLKQSDLILYLDYSGPTAAFGGFQRWLKYCGKKRPEMPDGCIERFNLDFLKTMFLSKERPHIEGILSNLRQLNIIRIKSRREAEACLQNFISTQA